MSKLNLDVIDEENARTGQRKTGQCDAQSMGMEQEKLEKKHNNEYLFLFSKENICVYQKKAVNLHDFLEWNP